MAKMYYDRDADLKALQGKTVAIIGYGSQGRAHALNLHDSGIQVVVGLQTSSATCAEVQEDGLETVTPAEGTRRADVVMILVPDEKQAALYRSEVGPNLRPGMALAFAHGFNIHFSQIVPPAEVDVFMIAPKGPGKLVRQTYAEGAGVPSLLAIHQDATGKARPIALAYAKALGATRAGVIETTFAEETETDLFGEQTVLCGGVTGLMKAGFETLVEAGYQPEIAYFECLHEMKLIVDLIYEGGFELMRHYISDTAEYGDLAIGPKLIDNSIKEKMKAILADIRSGRFAKEWITENQAGRPVMNALRRQAQEHLVAKVGEQLRSMMEWIASKNRERQASGAY